MRALVWSAQLSWRSRERLRRWRLCGPLEASIGLTPARAAKGGFAADPVRVRGRDKDVGGAERPDAWLVEQPWAEDAGQLLELVVDLGEFVLELADPLRQPAQRRVLLGSQQGAVSKRCGRLLFEPRAQSRLERDDCRSQLVGRLCACVLGEQRPRD